jgi:hypothetical protein
MESAARLDLQFLFNALQMLSVATLKGAMLACVWLGKVNKDLRANMTVIATTTKFVKTPFALLAVTLLGHLTTNGFFKILTLLNTC